MFGNYCRTILYLTLIGWVKARCFGVTEYACRTTLNLTGNCVPLNDCPSLFQISKKQPLSDDDEHLLRSSQCDHKNGKPYVCCSNVEEELQKDISCKTPEDTPGNCVMFQDCARIYQIIQNQPISNEAKQFLRKSQCGFKNGRPYVCCAILPEAANLGWDITTVLLPAQRTSLLDCPIRYQRPIEYPLFRGPNRHLVEYGTAAKKHEFPHMAAIGWTKKDGSGIDWHCGGSLITSKAVLTAAHCFDDARPDVVRLGHNDLDSTSELAKQFQIERHIKHPNYRRSKNYNDIAILLLRVDEDLSEFMAPLCLWRENSFVFDDFMVAGWGKTETGYSSKILMKANLQPANMSKCIAAFKNERKQPDGVLSTQICAGDTLKDTCSGDSGGPFQVKLLGANNWTPFLVGIISAGRGCGPGLPSLYTRVSSYIDWISQTLNGTVNTDPVECTINYQPVEESKTTGLPHQISSVIRLDRTTRHVIQIGWELPNPNTNYVGVSWVCGGVLVSEDYVLTSAQCLNRKERAPDMIGTLDSQHIRVMKIINHPEFRPNDFSHDLALVRLSKKVTVSPEGAQVACLWPNDEPNFNYKQLQMSAFAPAHAHPIFYEGAREVEYLSTHENLMVAITMEDHQEHCKLIDGLNSHYQICMRNHFPIVPGVCNTSPGGGVHQHLYYNGEVIDFVFAITSTGDNCGFNTSIVATKVQPYLGWIDSVVFGRAPNKLAFKADWPQEMFDAAKQPSTNELDTIRGCPYKYANLREDSFSKVTLNSRRRRAFYNELAHIGELYVKQNPLLSCHTTLISSQHVITSVKCAENIQTKEMKLGWNQKQVQYFNITKFVMHPEYNRNAAHVNDLVVLKLNTTVRFNHYVQPACIWADDNVIPYKLQQPVLNKTYDIYFQNYAYNADCKTKMDRHRSPNQVELSELILCVQEHICPKLGDPIQKMISVDNKLVPFVFGVHFQKRNCTANDDPLPYMYTRLTPYVDWIQKVVGE